MSVIKLFESISSTDNQILCGSPDNINTIRSKMCIQTAFQFFFFFYRHILGKDVGLEHFITQVCVCVAHTGPVFIPGVAGQRLQPKAVERHV